MFEAIRLDRPPAMTALRLVPPPRQLGNQPGTGEPARPTVEVDPAARMDDDAIGLDLILVAVVLAPVIAVAVLGWLAWRLVRRSVPPAGRWLVARTRRWLARKREQVTAP